MQCEQWFPPIPEADCSQPGVDLSITGVPVLLATTATAAPTVIHLAAGQLDPAIGSNLLDTCSAQSNMCHRLGFLQAIGNRLGDSLECLLMK
jgi:hypothetical protein